MFRVDILYDSASAVGAYGVGATEPIAYSSAFKRYEAAFGTIDDENSPQSVLVAEDDAQIWSGDWSKYMVRKSNPRYFPDDSDWMPCDREFWERDD